MIQTACAPGPSWALFLPFNGALGETMRDYHVYTLDKAGHFVDVRELQCAMMPRL